MTAKELIAELSEMPPEVEVYFDAMYDDEPCSKVDRVEFNQSPDKPVIDGVQTRIVAEGVFLS